MSAAVRSGELGLERKGRLGIVVLDRPQALNALTHDMVRGLSRQLAVWHDDPEISAVLVKAAPGRAFCAGGDIRVVAALAATGGVAAALPFFHDEYRLNWRVHEFAKPYIALIDGIVMGGGVGISVHGSHRVVSEQAVFAMPETGIGFFPDVGGTWFLPRCPGEVGTWLGLTGARLEAADMLLAGIATHYVPAAEMPALEAELADAEDPERVLERYTTSPGGGRLRALRARIDHCFAGADLGTILRQLDEESSGFGAEQRRILEEKSPLSVHVALAQLRAGRELGFADCMRLEYRLTQRFLAADDFREGVRALIVDKDKRPRWRHRRLEDVSAAEVAACLAPAPGSELDLDWTGI